MAEFPARGILILGGLGYLGSRLAEALAGDGPVTVSSRRTSAARTRWLAAHAPAVTWQHFDSGDASDVTGEFDAVINCATPSAAEAGRDPAGATELALKTVETCLRLLKDGRARRVIHFSTFHVYGSPDSRVIRETDAPRPTHAYGEMHLACEQTLRAFRSHAPIAVLRPTNIIGAPAHGDLGVQSNLLFLDCCRQAACDQKIVLRSNGRGYRDFVPMEDAIRAVQLLLGQDVAGPEMFNLATGEAVTVALAADQIRQEAASWLNVPVELVLGSSEDAFGQKFVVDRTKLATKGWEPRGSVQQEIRDTLDFFRADQPVPARQV